MSRRALNFIGILILMGITAAISIFAYNAFVGGSGEATVPLTAPTLDLSTATPNALQTRVAELEATNAALSTAVAGRSEATAEATSESTAEKTAEATTATVETTAEATAESTTQAAAAATVEKTAEATAESTAESTSEAAVAEAAAAVQAAGAAQVAAAGTLYRIDTTNSLVSFTLTEDLRGQPTTVVGTTDQVAGDIFVDFTTPANSKMGVIRINARTLVTPENQRNNAIRARILQSADDKYQFIEFTPTAITGLPDKVEVGSTIKFKITGDLKIRDIVQSVTFDVSVTAAADSLTGSATAQITRDQFNLQIPFVPFVANVSNEVTLDIKFTAPKVAQ